MHQSLPVPPLPVSDDNRREFASLGLLILAGMWMAGMAFVLANLADSWSFAVAPLGFAAILILLAFASWTPDLAWDKLGRIGLWFVLGMTFTIWVVGIVSFGWLVFPTLLLEVFALIAWPRSPTESLAIKEGILAKVLSFLVIPALFFSALWFGL